MEYVICISLGDKVPAHRVLFFHADIYKVNGWYNGGKHGNIFSKTDTPTTPFGNSFAFEFHNGQQNIIPKEP